MLTGVQAVSSSEEEQDESRDANEDDKMDQDQNGEREEEVKFIAILEEGDMDESPSEIFYISSTFLQLKTFFVASRFHDFSI